MAVLTVGGVVIPAPSDLQVGIMDLSKAERNANGTMIIERIATKRKLELSYSFLTRTQLQQVLVAVSPIFFTVTYIDPQTNANRTGTFYCGDRSVGVLDMVNGEPRYKDIKFNLVER
jgi:hypothetical protein